jgi:uncharacterized protein with NAD-binding domain and iron-sulfur cluster
MALGTSPIVRALIDPEGGMADVRKLDNISFADWFRGHGGNQAAIDRMWDPIGGRHIIDASDMLNMWLLQVLHVLVVCFADAHTSDGCMASARRVAERSCG